MNSLITILAILAFLVIYFLPSALGYSRGIANPGALLAVNLLFGWTGVGWLVCLIWAVAGQTAAADAYYRSQRKV